jgi:hypothetical protein
MLRRNAVARVYSLRAVARLLEEENLVQAEHFGIEYIVSKLTYLSNMFACIENREYGLGIRCADHATPSIRKSCH